MKILNKILFLLFLIYVFNNIGISQNFGGWIIIDSTIERRTKPATTILNNGNFLVSGGGYDSAFVFSSSEIFDTLLKGWRYTNPMLKPRSSHKIITLNNGRVLVLGGFSNNYYTRSCELFDPASETWSMTDSMITLREFGGYTITVLKDSNVLVTGGWNRNEGAINKCEIYDIKQNRWRMIDTLRIKREEHTATLLSDGRVLIAGGGRGGGNNLGFCEIYDPIKDTFYLVRQMNVPRHQHSAVLLPNGKVLVSGGRNDNINWLRGIEVYDPSKDLWYLVDSLIVPRTKHYSIILNDSLILFAGGYHNSETWEIYDYKNFRPLYIDFLPIVFYGYTVHSLGDGKAVGLGGSQYFFINDDKYIYPSRQVLIYDPLITFVENYESKQTKAFALYQNYPNPFNPITTIKFSLPEKLNVKITVYDVLGRKIKDLINETKEAGIHSVDFDGSALSSGIYFYRMDAGKYSDIKKMILVK